jgi:hypothetical protein
VGFLGYKQGLAHKFSRQIKKEHQHIMNLLDDAESELVETHPDSFRAVIKSLETALRDHLQIDHEVPYEIWGGTLEDEVYKRMLKRAQDGFLGLE